MTVTPHVMQITSQGDPSYSAKSQTPRRCACGERVQVSGRQHGDPQFWPAC